MGKTVVFVTNQYSCDRMIYSGRVIADETSTELVVVGIMDAEYALDPKVVDYLFVLSKKNQATMRLIFSEDKIKVMSEMVAQYESQYIVTGMPSSNQSVLYDLWKEHGGKQFYTVDSTGELVEVAASIKSCIA